MIRSAWSFCASAPRLQPLVVALLFTANAAAAVAPPRAAVSIPHRYKLVLLLAGDRPPITKELGDNMQAAHLANIGAMFRAGALDAAGPFGDESPLIGLFVFHSEDADLLSLLAPDPIVRSGRLVAQPYTWVAPEGLGKAYRERGAIAPGRDSMVSYSFVLLHRGPNWTAEDAMGTAHARAVIESQIDRWRREGGMRMGGPIEGTGDLRAVCIFATDSAKTARQVSRDPAFRAGRFLAEIHPWWTSFGIVPGP